MELGTRLREARESKDLSLEDIQQVTKIQKRYLQAIEKGDHSVLPGTFYARAFIREYAAAVGLSPDEIMEEHKNELPASPEESAVSYNRMQRSKEEASTSNGSFSRIFPTIITIILIGIIIFAAYFFLSKLDSGNNDETVQESKSGDEIIVEDSSGESNSTKNGGENKQGTDSKDEKAKETETQRDDADQNDEEAKEVSAKVTETGSGSFPQHTIEVSESEELELTIELNDTSYLEVKKGPDGETFIPSIEYGKDDSPITIDISDEKQVYIKTGYVPAATIKLNGRKIEFPADKMQQKLLLKVAE
ncbi:helix-turn-helix domain-containing protein [Thalassobacillus devorans]|uniref:helix-turn-helix domain-containing protein n=1 Tax=Thalassobacillus devorans TaxID=279813 RepID=UPI00048EA1E6|nr:helix-turn-helix domain-containing protein [Thalassobacillus devorans]